MFVFVVIIFGFLLEMGFLCRFGTSPGTSSPGPGWPQSHRGPPVSVSRVLEFKACTTTAQLHSNFYTFFSQFFFSNPMIYHRVVLITSMPSLLSTNFLPHPFGSFCFYFLKETKNKLSVFFSFLHT